MLYTIISFGQLALFNLGYRNLFPQKLLVEKLIAEPGNEIFIDSAAVAIPIIDDVSCLAFARDLLRESGFKFHDASGSVSINGYSSSAGQAASIRCRRVGGYTIAIAMVADDTGAYRYVGNRVSELHQKIRIFSQSHQSKLQENASFEQLSALDPFHGYQTGVYQGDQSECKFSARRSLESNGFKVKNIDGNSISGMKPFFRFSIMCVNLGTEDTLVFYVGSANYDTNGFVADIRSMRQSVYNEMGLIPLTQSNR